MSKLNLWVMTLLWFVIIGQADAFDGDEEGNSSLTMTCDYSANRESVLVSQSLDSSAQVAAIKVLSPKSKDSKTAFSVNAGQFAECVYPSGTRVRIKVGEGLARSYGRCGGDPDAFLSMWVNERKLVSRLWFAGHCIEESQLPPSTLSFKVQGNTPSPAVQRCQTASQQVDGVEEKMQAVTEPLTVCVDFPDVKNFPHDQQEYPTKGHKKPIVGEVLLVNGSAKVCETVWRELKTDFKLFAIYSELKPSKLTFPKWKESAVRVLNNITQGIPLSSVFDFDNDGKQDKVFYQDAETNGFDGSVLYIQKGRLTSVFAKRDSRHDATPCQNGLIQYESHGCPAFDFPRGNNEAFIFKRKTTEDSVTFGHQVTELWPFRWQGKSYVSVYSTAEDTLNYVAVIKPRPNRTFQQMCLFQQVAENF